MNVLFVSSNDGDSCVANFVEKDFEVVEDGSTYFPIFEKMIAGGEDTYYCEMGYAAWNAVVEVSLNQGGTGFLKQVDYTITIVSPE